MDALVEIAICMCVRHAFIYFILHTCNVCAECWTQQILLSENERLLFLRD